MASDRERDFVQQVSRGHVGLLRETWAWLHYNKKWWLAPIVLVLLSVGLLVILSGTAAAPFIYTLF